MIRQVSTWNVLASTRQTNNAADNIMAINRSWAVSLLSSTYSYPGCFTTHGILNLIEYFRTRQVLPSLSLLWLISYRGLDGLSNTVDTAIRIDFTLCRGCTLYPHHGTHGLVLPFGWTNDVPTKPAWPVTLPSYHRPSYPFLESSPGWPRVLKTPATVVAKLTVPNGDAGK